MEDTQKGLYTKYIIQKADGSKLELGAEYFVLRLDMLHIDKKEDFIHRKACRKAIRKYAKAIKHVFPELHKELLKRYRK